MEHVHNDDQNKLKYTKKPFLTCCHGTNYSIRTCVMSEFQSLNTTLLVFGTVQDMSDSQVNEPRKDIYSRICSCQQNIYVIQKLMYNMHVKKVYP